MTVPREKRESKRRDINNARVDHIEMQSTFVCIPFRKPQSLLIMCKLNVILPCATRQVWKMVMMLRAIFSSRSSATIGVLMMKPDDYIGKRDRKINDLWLLIEWTRNETKREEVFDEKLVDAISRNSLIETLNRRTIVFVFVFGERETENMS